MFSTLSFSVSPTLIHKPQDPSSKDTNLPKPNNGEKPCQQFLLDNKKVSKRKLLSSALLGWAQHWLSVARPVKAEQLDSPAASASCRMSYSRFLQYLDEGAVKKVNLLENGTVAIAEIYNPTLEKIQRVKIQLPGLPQELVRKMKDKNVDFAAHPMEISFWPAMLDLLENLAFPLILLGSLLLMRSSTNNPGGPNLPFGLGRYEFSNKYM